MDEEGFLQILAADPWDDATRWVYTDWLQERGDPRGDYLRLERELLATSDMLDDHTSYRLLKLMPIGDWVFRAGKRYDTLLVFYDPRVRDAVLEVIQDLLQVDLEEAVDLAPDLPLPLFENQGLWNALWSSEETATKIIGGGDFSFNQELVSRVRWAYRPTKKPAKQSHRVVRGS